MIINVGGGSGGYTLTVQTSAGATVTVSKDGNTYTETTNSSGMTTFSKLASGTWSYTITKGSITKTGTVSITQDVSISVMLRQIPEFTYSGSCALVDDNNNAISDPDAYNGNWKIRFLTGGNLKFSKLNAVSTIDVFLVGGGGGGSGDIYRGGGGGGYTKTQRNVGINTTNTYVIVIGAGGANGSNGGATSAFGYEATGGVRASHSGHGGGDGGSGGGQGSGSLSYPNAGNGGSDGGNGEWDTSDGGTGQGSTTREFGETGKKLYAGGGAGIGFDSETNTAKGGEGGGGNSLSSGGANTGGGAGAFANGGSGIVVIRNKR